MSDPEVVSPLWARWSIGVLMAFMAVMCGWKCLELVGVL